ncbi:MAG: hypothetical protein ACRC02_07120, partial [Vogesella sp.]|uniref:hypothetical protein n=1 Tax=Vogesella sp. TaxID=1904252 RepID=UPI003F40F7E7
MTSAVILVLLIGALAYFRAPVIAWTIAIAGWIASLQFVWGCQVPVAVWAVFGVIAAVLNLTPLRRAVFTGP